MGPREEILALLRGGNVSPPPAFSGLVHVTTAGMDSEGIAFAQAHRDPEKLRRLAGSTFRLTGLPSAAMPFDLCVEAEALGAVVDFGEQGKLDFPRVIGAPYSDLDNLRQRLERETRLREIHDRARLPVICTALASLKSEVGGQAVIGGILAGPFTVLSMLLERASLFAAMKQKAGSVLEVLSLLSDFIRKVGMAYRAAGADFLTIHEMGGSASLLGDRSFEKIVFPSLHEMLKHLPGPTVLAVCGKVEGIASLLGQAQASALSIDQSNSLTALRKALPNASLFGNIDPVDTLALGTPDEVRAAAQKARLAGMQAVWPGCDLMPGTPIENIKALLG